MPVGDFSISQKIVAITGAGTGINLTFAQLAASKGAKIVIGDLRLSPEAEEFVKSSEDVVFAKCDVTKWKDLQNLVTVSEQTFGDVPDVYVPGAGIFEPVFSSFWHDREEERYASIDINTQHPIKFTRMATRALLGRNKPGVVVVISSVAGLRGAYMCPLYCATKFAMVGFVKSLAFADEDQGVKVVCICPGPVDTGIFDDFAHNMDLLNTGKRISPAEIAEAMLELVQEEQYPGGTIMEFASPGNKSVLERQQSGRSGGHGSIQEILTKERSAR